MLFAIYYAYKIVVTRMNKKKKKKKKFYAKPYCWNGG